MKTTLLTRVESNRINNLFFINCSPLGISKMAGKKRGLMAQRVAGAPGHAALVNEGVHVFVDDQNLFWGITNDIYGKGYRVDFGRLLLEAAKGPKGSCATSSDRFYRWGYPR
jgi:hypothetical protein